MAALMILPRKSVSFGPRAFAPLLSSSGSAKFSFSALISSLVRPGMIGLLGRSLGLVASPVFDPGQPEDVLEPGGILTG